MKATIQQVNRYVVTIGDSEFENFTRAEEWEGMIKFSGPAGTIIVDADKFDFSSMFERLFEPAVEKEAHAFTIIKASPGLIPE